MEKYDAIVVIYNKDIMSVPAVSTLSALSCIKRIVVCDNSDKPNKNGETSLLFPKVRYRFMGGNLGLSKAYNFAISECCSDFVCIFDDDTTIPDDFFIKANDYIVPDIDAVYLPLVYSNKILMSPCIKDRHRFRAIKDLAQLRESRISAINSGMIVSRNIYSKCRYNESLFLDMIDHDFMDSIRNAGYRIIVMDNVFLAQNYSRETDDCSSRFRRLRISRSDNRVYYSHSIAEMAFCEMQIIYWYITAIASCVMVLVRKMLSSHHTVDR